MLVNTRLENLNQDLGLIPIGSREDLVAHDDGRLSWMLVVPLSKMLALFFLAVGLSMSSLVRCTENMPTSSTSISANGEVNRCVKQDLHCGHKASSMALLWNLDMEQSGKNVPRMCLSFESDSVMGYTRSEEARQEGAWGC